MARGLAHRGVTVQRPVKSGELDRMKPDSHHCVPLTPCSTDADLTAFSRLVPGKYPVGT